jgi:hypothetical protein
MPYSPTNCCYLLLIQLCQESMRIHTWDNMRRWQKIPICTHLERRTEEEPEGILFVLLMLRNYSSGMGLCVGISIAILHNHG